MRSIGGNIKARFEVKTSTKNEIGEDISQWNEVLVHRGYLDTLSSDNRYSSFESKTEESSQVFICDYNPTLYGFLSRNLRCVIGNRAYEVTRIDNPMELNRHLEVYLRYVGEG